MKTESISQSFLADNMQAIGIGAGLFVAFVALMLAFKWREVVSTNVVHIVQSRKLTISYGTNQDAGNVYYAIPAYIPFFGLSRTVLPVNNFALNLHEYKAYDKDRVPFELDVTAFFRIADTNMAAKRVSSFDELHKQLVSIVQGAARKILASHEINSIMVDRATFGEQFTKEVANELQNWGVEPVKNMELMDIRDTGESRVIANIMAKKISHIEMESRTEVAANKQKATVAETEARRISDTAQIEAAQRTEVAKLEAQQTIGQRAAEAEKQVGVAKVDQERAIGVSREQASQLVQVEAAKTKQKQMEVVSVEVQRKAEIEKAAGIVKAEETAAVVAKNAEGQASAMVLEAQGKLQQTTLAADGQLVIAQRTAEGVRTSGQAKADAEAAMAEAVRANGKAKADAETAMAEAVKAMQLAPIEAQVKLAKEIGENQGYQTYLVTLKRVEAEQAIGIAQASALTKADVKVIVNSGNASSGIGSIGELLSSSGGQKFGAFLEGLKNTDTGSKLVDKVTDSGNGKAARA